jgi:pilus assembly protein CpaF
MIVGEVRSEECLDLLLALNAGLPGLATIHANSARELPHRGMRVRLRPPCT